MAISWCVRGTGLFYSSEGRLASASGLPWLMPFLPGPIDLAQPSLCFVPGFVFGEPGNGLGRGLFMPGGLTCVSSAVRALVMAISPTTHLAIWFVLVVVLSVGAERGGSLV